MLLSLTLVFPVFHGLYFNSQSEPPGTHDYQEISVSSLVPELLPIALTASYQSISSLCEMFNYWVLVLSKNSMTFSSVKAVRTG
ncbi:hypothetical protein BDR03DRAFT_952923, partial [Suillus americanus]